MRTRVVWLTAVLLIGFIGIGPGHAQEVVNLLPNGGFETGNAGPWNIYGDVTSEVVTECVDAAVPEDPIEGDYCLHLVVPAAGAGPHESGMSDGSYIFEQGKKYTFSCFIKCKSGTLQFRMKPEHCVDPWEAYGDQVFTATEEWQEFYVTTPVFTEDVTPASPSFHLAFAPGDFWMDGIRFYEGDYVPPKIFPELATKPSPEDKASDVPQDVVLSWAPGEFADTHNVYFGDNFDDVNNADTTNTLDVLVSPGQTATTYDPDGLLDFGQTYYWRVDEVNAPPDSTVFKGYVWSFTAEPFAYPIENISATSSSFSEGMGPEKTVDSSGLNDSDQHSTEAMDMWLSNLEGPQPTWIQYEFDRAYKLDEMWVWNSNQSIEASIGFGAKDITIEYSEDGAAWTVLGDVELVQATGQADYTPNKMVVLGGVLAKYVRMNVSSNWSTFPLEQFGLSEVRFFYVPVQAREPKPASGEADVALDVVLEWRAGREAASHEVSFSSDRDAVINGTAPVDIATENRYEPGPLEFGQIYYWKVNEVNEAASPSSWESDVWSFSTIEYFVVDDFEDYNDFEPDTIFDTWIDGWNVDTNGAVVGYPNPDFDAGEHFAETTIVHGGSQSMPYFYDNNFKYSEAVMTLSAARNWTQGGATKLSLWFYGDPNNAAERMYVALNGSASVYHDDPGATQIDTWTEWTIDLQEFAAQGVDLTNVNTIAIGFGDKNNLQPGGPGLVFFDDIRVGRPIESFGLVAYYPLDEGAGTIITDASGKGHDGTLTGDGAEWVESQEGYGSALKFPGDVAPSPFVNTGIWNPSERTGELTVAVWIKWEGLSGNYQGIVGKRDSWNATDTYWGLELNVDSGNIGFSRWDNYPWFGDNIPPVGEWQHIAVTFDGTTTIMYIDGGEVGRDTGFSFGAGENAGVVFGAVETSGSNPFNGTIDEVRLYDTALSADEILELAGR